MLTLATCPSGTEKARDLSAAPHGEVTGFDSGEGALESPALNGGAASGSGGGQQEALTEQEAIGKHSGLHILLPAQCGSVMEPEIGHWPGGHAASAPAPPSTLFLGDNFLLTTDGTPVINSSQNWTTCLNDCRVQEPANCWPVISILSRLTSLSLRLSM